MKLTEEQLAQLQVEVAKKESAGHYGDAYGYLGSIVPQTGTLYYPGYGPVHNAVYTHEEMGLRLWFLVAENTNSQNGKIIDSSLRKITEQIMIDKGIGDLYSDEKYNELSNDLAKQIFENILEKGGVVDLKWIVQADAENFTGFAPGGELKPGDWPGALGDGILLGGDHVKDENWNTWMKIKGIAFGVFDGINNYVNDAFNDAQSFVPRRDPLTLDLNGNGIETLGIDAGVVFDFDGDGIKTGTGWVAGTDGFLVYDRDGNGTIDNGSELFGVDTVKSDGSYATDGFDALRDFDSNGDGIFDRNDQMFSQVKVWQDLNSDGISQVDELKTLEETGIVAVNLNARKTSIGSNGNLISAVGSFIWEDGSAGEVNANQSIVANLDLSDNPFYREFADKIQLDEASSVLPELKGSGAVRDLREATMLSAELKELVGQYAVATTRDEQLALLDSVISAWSKTADYKTFDEKIASITVNGEAIQFAYSWELNNSQPTAAQLKQKEFLENLKVLEIFNAQGFVSYQLTTNKENQPQLSIKVGATSYLVDIDPDYPVITEQDILLNSGQMGFLMQSYQHIRESFYDGLLLFTRLEPYTDLIKFTIKDYEVNVGFEGFDGFANEQFAVRPANALQDLLDFNRVYGDSLHSIPPYS